MLHFLRDVCGVPTYRRGQRLDCDERKPKSARADGLTDELRNPERHLLQRITGEL
jgi:hypothetical protein